MSKIKQFIIISVSVIFVLLSACFLFYTHDKSINNDKDIIIQKYGVLLEDCMKNEYYNDKYVKYLEEKCKD